MTTLDSPRASVASIPRVQSPASERSSTSTDRPTTSAGTAPRRNRAALRDYYGLKVPSPVNGADTTPEALPAEIESELDKANFAPQEYINDLLAKETLEGVLKVETGLISDIKSLDGERKALVYDNYSKLIAATDTIKNMRSNMDPLVPITSTLEPAVARIADTAGELTRSLSERIGQSGPNGMKENSSRVGDEDTEKTKLQTVKWVLDGPRRLQGLIQEDKREAAEAEWVELDQILTKWNGVKGVDQVREQAIAALGR